MMKIIQFLFLLLLGAMCQTIVSGQPSVQQQAEGKQPREIFLYPEIAEEVPEEHVWDKNGNLIVSKVTNPSLTLFILPDSNQHKPAVIICPGGGYTNLHIQREGFKVAEAFNQQGITAFVLKSRLPDEDIIEESEFAPLRDAQRAIQMARENAEQWGIDPDKIGIMGFSAGGHLAASAGVHHNFELIENNKNTSLRPDFMILVYPVITFNSTVGHIGSRINLLGECSDDDKQVRFFSTERQVNHDTPPCILFHADDDTMVPVENSLLFYNKLHQHDVPVELHVYSKGEHGFLQVPRFSEWFTTCIQWMDR